MALGFGRGRAGAARGSDGRTSTKPLTRTRLCICRSRCLKTPTCAAWRCRLMGGPLSSPPSSPTSISCGFVLDETAFRGLPGTDLARVPFWSPDSRWIGFFADGKLKDNFRRGRCEPSPLRIGTRGGGGTWNRGRDDSLWAAATGTDFARRSSGRRLRTDDKTGGRSRSHVSGIPAGRPAFLLCRHSWRPVQARTLRRVA